MTPGPVDIGPWFGDAVRVARHRGPDGAGFWVAGDSATRPIAELDGCAIPPTAAALGFSRLAIIDLSRAGDQPMVVPGRATLVFNGEIYNYVELRAELGSLGWAFVSTGDAEVLAKALLQWGLEAMARFDGMWAFALVDQRTGSLLLSRDRFGEKPLFWTHWRDGLAFASEVKQLACYPGIAPKVDLRRAAGFLVTGRPYDGPASWFDEIHSLEPGGWLLARGSDVRTGSYHDLEHEIASVTPERSPGDWAARFGESLAASVRRRLRSDVPIGTSLSAGIDSSMVLAEATAQGRRAYRAFTLGSDDPRLDERDEAARFAASQGSLWHGELADGAEFASLWDHMTLTHEIPVAGTSMYGQWKVYEAARIAGVPVMLDGQGADEILGGYDKFVAAILWRTAISRPHRLRGPLIGFRRQVRDLHTLRTAGHRYLGRFGGGPRVRSWLRPGLYAGERTPRVRTTTLDQRLQDIRRWSLPNLLAFADRNSMAHSVEVRLPYLEPSLVALALAMPDDVLFRDGWTKWPLRVSLAAHAGSAPAWSPGKRWFSVPQRSWLYGPLRPMVDEWLASPHEAWDAIVDPARLVELRTSIRDGRRTHAGDDLVFQMVALDRFLRVWMPG